MATGQVHKFIIDGTRIVLDVNSGSLHVVDELAWQVINAFEKPDRAGALALLAESESAEAVAEAQSEVEGLISQGLLFAGDGHLARYQPPAAEPLKALCLHVAHDCNLRCRYCFADSGPFGGHRGLMPAETARAAVDLLIKDSGARPLCEIDFFGGEPLLNFPVVRETVAYAREAGERAGKQFRFTLTTNAVLLDDEAMDFLDREDISLILSLDGRESVNDAMRLDASGRGSYNRVVDRIDHCLDSRRKFGTSAYAIIRGTYTGANLDFAADVLHLANRGYLNLSMEPVVVGPGEPYALRDEHLPALSAEYEELAREYLRRREEGVPFTFYHFELDLRQGPCLPKRLAGCGAGFQYLAVTPDGGLYPCHQFVGRPEYRLGNVSEGIQRRDLTEVFRQSHVFTKQECPACWARFYCSGGCHANNVKYGGSLEQPYHLGCELQKKRLECALWIKAREHTSVLADDARIGDS